MALPREATAGCTAPRPEASWAAPAGWAQPSRAQWQGSERNEDSTRQRPRGSNDPGGTGAGSASRLPKRATTAPAT